MRRKPRVLDLIVKTVVTVSVGRRRARQARVDRATPAQRKLYAAQRKLDLPPGHPYA